MRDITRFCIAHVHTLNIITQTAILNLTFSTWRIWWAPTNVSKWQMGFNSAFKGLILSVVCKTKVCKSYNTRFDSSMSTNHIVKLSRKLFVKHHIKYYDVYMRGICESPIYVSCHFNGYFQSVVFKHTYAWVLRHCYLFLISFTYWCLSL